tara:strand:- start:3882 stop:4349 length:468 start_codon:yes stop_codon:yes gene_type:complete
MFNEVMEKLFKHEGGYVNDKTDLGGETKYGITKRFYPDVDIKNLTKEDAKEIYYRDYWVKHKVTTLPEELRYIYFDMCVNMGKKTAVKILQRAANSKGRNIDVDGGYGPKTRAAMTGIELDRVRAYRVKYYVDLIKERPEQEKFYFGWFKRSMSV